MLLSGACLAFAIPAAADDDDAEELAPLAFLGLQAASGTTETKGDAGKIEGQMLYSALVQHGTESVWDDISNRLGGRSVVPSIGNTNGSLRPYYLVDSRLKLISEARQFWSGLECNVAPVNKSNDQVSGLEAGGVDTSPQALLSTVTGLMRTDTTLTGFEVKPSDELILTGLVRASNHSPRLRNPSDIQIVSSGGNSILTRYRQELGAIGQLIARKCNKHPGHGAAIVQANAELADMAKGGDKGAPGLLEQAMLLEPLLGDNPAQPPLILHVNADYGGSTMIKAQNIFTTLGAQALSFRAGLVLHYRLVDPANGATLHSGIVRCGTRPIGYRRIVSAAERIDGSSCAPPQS